jgi:hypothetical protein
VTNVRMDMEEDDESLFGEVLEAVGKGIGQERDHTGVEIGGGGGMAVCLLFDGG